MQSEWFLERILRHRSVFILFMKLLKEDQPFYYYFDHYFLLFYYFDFDLISCKQNWSKELQTSVILYDFVVIDCMISGMDRIQGFLLVFN